jgi:hypothetical protein
MSGQGLINNGGIWVADVKQQIQSRVSNFVLQSGTQSLVSLACVALVCHSAGAVASWWPTVASRTGAVAALNADDSVALGSLALALALLRVPSALTRSGLRSQLAFNQKN